MGGGVLTYCEDCGAANDAGAALCRMCSRTLLSNPGPTPCSSCGNPIGVGAAFCASCGAANYQPAAVLSPNAVPEPVAIPDAVMAAEPEPETPTGGLRLPEWLLSTSPDQRPREADATVRQAPAGRLPIATAEDRPLRPIPDGGLAKAMPDWLRGGESSRQPSAAVAESKRIADSTLTDTTSFVSENDLPEWIRQIAAKDAAAVGAAPPEGEQSSLDVSDLFTSATDAPSAPVGRIAQLLGEPAVPEPASASPAWLARRQGERQASQIGETRELSAQAAFASLAQAGAAVESARNTPAMVAGALPGAGLSSPNSAEPVQTHPAPSGAELRARWLRPLLLALVLLALAVVIYQVASGG